MSGCLLAVALTLSLALPATAAPKNVVLLAAWREKTSDPWLVKGKHE